MTAPRAGLLSALPDVGKVVAFGVIYFALTAWSELGGHRWTAKMKVGVMDLTPGDRLGSRGSR